jgi:hypothetical protein
MYVLRVLIMLSIDDIARAMPQLTLKELELNRQDWVCVSFYNANAVCLLYQLSFNFSALDICPVLSSDSDYRREVACCEKQN